MTEQTDKTSNPVDNSSTEKIISAICTIYSGHSFYQIYKSSSFIKSIFADSGVGLDMYTILYLVPLILLPIATFLFWKRKKIGWVLLLSYLTIAGICILYDVYNSLAIQDNNYNIFNSTSSIGYTLATILLIGGLITICITKIRISYEINSKLFLATIITSIALAILFISLHRQSFNKINTETALEDNSSSEQIPEWEVYYGEVDNAHSYIQTGDNFFYNNIEFLFINQNNNGYQNIDTNSIAKAQSLTEEKLAFIQKAGDTISGFNKIEKIPIDNSSFFIRLLNSNRGTVLYKIKGDNNNFTLEEFSIMQNDTVPVMWTNRKSRTTKTGSFKKLNNLTF